MFQATIGMISIPMRRAWVTNSFFLVLVLLQRECLSFFSVPVQQQRIHVGIWSLSSSSSLSEQLSVSATNRKWRRHQREKRLYSAVTDEVVGSEIVDVSPDFSIGSQDEVAVSDISGISAIDDESEAIASPPAKKAKKKKTDASVAVLDSPVDTAADVLSVDIGEEGVVTVVGGGVGTGHAHSEISKSRISAANKGKVPWNAGKKHSEETKARIAEKTKEAMLKRKVNIALAAGFSTLEEFDEAKLRDKIAAKVEKDKNKVKGLTSEGRKRISDSLKKRWEDPEFRLKYSEVTKGNRSHSNETRAKIAAAITTKWQDAEYRAKISMSPTDEVKARISATLKARWEDPEFREKMLTRSFERTDEWRALVSDRIRAKWSDPEYRAAVAVGIRNSNKTSMSGLSLHRVRGVTDATKSRRQAVEQKKREKEARIALKIREKNRKEAIKTAKIAARGAKGKSIKELLGGELWFEEKLKRRKDGNPFMDDETLEKQLTEEWKDEDLTSMDETEEEDEEEGEVRERDEFNDEIWEEIDVDALDDALDIIEVYDEDGELVGTYTGAEFDKLKKNKY